MPNPQVRRRPEGRQVRWVPALCQRLAAGLVGQADAVTVRHGRPGVSTAKVGLGRNGPVRRATEFALVHPHGQWVASQLATGSIIWGYM